MSSQKGELMTSTPRLALAALATLLLPLLQTPYAAAAPHDLVADPASAVNPFIGTTNEADDFPGADAPFGMVQWSPDTPNRPAGGVYEYGDNQIIGFSLNVVF